MVHFAMGLEDVFYPIETFHWKNTAVIALSESGETEKLIEAASQFKKKNCCVLSITNSPFSTLIPNELTGDITAQHKFLPFLLLKRLQKEYKETACYLNRDWR